MSNPENLAPYGRGICLVCDREFNLKRNGTVRAHGSQQRGVWPPMNCSGSGWQPKGVSGVE